VLVFLNGVVLSVMTVTYHCWVQQGQVCDFLDKINPPFDSRGS